MFKFIKSCFFLAMSLPFSFVFANSVPVVSNVTASQRIDGSGIVDISYTLSDADDDKCTVSVLVSSDSGSTWTITPSSVALSGDIGSNISTGRKHILWASKTDLPGEYGSNYRVKIMVDDGVVDEPAGMAWVYINESGFTGYMSKYETTNAQYCQYLNAALAAGQIAVYNNKIYATSDTSHSYPYFLTSSYTSYSQIEDVNNVFSVRCRDGQDMSNHPVVCVSWEGASAFCNFCNYRLPTEDEWFAVADYDGSYYYGCGSTIDQYKANCQNANPLGLSSYPYTSPVGYYGAFGYGLCDLAGNVWELTSSDCHPICGGSWYHDYDYCHFNIEKVWLDRCTTGISIITGFRACH